MKTLSLRAHRGGLKIQPRYRLVLTPRPRRQKTFRARHRRPICSGWNRHALPGPNQRSSRGHKVCLLGAAARLRRGACFIAQTYRPRLMFFHRRQTERHFQEACSRPATETHLCQGFASAFVTAQDGLTLHVRRYSRRSSRSSHRRIGLRLPSELGARATVPSCRPMIRSSPERCEASVWNVSRHYGTSLTRWRAFRLWLSAAQIQICWPGPP